MPHVAKYISFMKKNNDIPFHVKRRVLDGTLVAISRVTVRVVDTY